MANTKDIKGDLLSDMKRITFFGSFLRKSSLDEIPQLINVLLGEMSLVGPRPLLTEYLPLYNAFQSRRHEILPGITGWAQVNGRNAIGWEEKFQFDVWYVDHCSFAIDFKILLMTISKVIQKNDIMANSEVTMERFTGTLN